MNMKKNLFMVAAVALMAMVSCNKEEINNNGAEQASDIVFVAEFDHEADTKIALGELVDGVRKTTWVAGDEIKINGTVFSAKAAGERTEFTTTGSFAGAATYRAVYPASSFISTAAVDIPSTQNGTFASASIAVAESSTTSLKFNNLVTILKFQVPVNCSKVTFESTASIAGRITVKYTDGVMKPDYTGVTNGSKTINVDGTFVPKTDYYVAVKPGTHTFTVKIDGYVSKKSTKSVTVERSQILNMGILPEPEKYTWGLVGQHQGWDITNPTPMYKVADNVYAALGITLQADGFKFAKTGLKDWNTSNTYFGAWKKSDNQNYFNFSSEMSTASWYGVYTNNLGGQSENIGVNDFSKKYDIYVKVIQNANWGDELGYTIVEAGTSVQI
jgi:hypothetical protein